ncbi:glycerophosphodiester phosphodiesterase [Levilactobacillus suantsaii]|uniref:Glycerophosphodiester phosphodiesterase n=1 Tax=Levilactobacillus suantsaii TaxID=2292255 RepID=A0A4Q0VFA7_9LACO|nr:glycerophosphodiester phosphodiesterase family protein [Levilactobacillus suantsaii]QMU08895.1 glycerophosphodiester phosphodiesterase [Levilactobacillus suantsaii]RXI76154.1 glycerophosphodiester phosphodiesterase [Levilactobacillus suantsaii]
MTATTMVFGHRGYPAKFPENSLAGFRYAVAHQIEGLEFDVHLTRDDVPVIMHDEKINRTTDGKGYLRDYTLAELQAFHLANGETVPTLAAFLQVVADQPVHLNLEFKTDKIQYPQIERIVLGMVHATSLVYPVIYSSFHLPTLKRCQQLAPNEIYCWLTDKRVKNAPAFVKKEGLAGLHLSHYQDDIPVVERIWTVDSVEQATQLFEDQVAGIFTDDFETMMALKQRLNQA